MFAAIFPGFSISWSSVVSTETTELRLPNSPVFFRKWTLAEHRPPRPCPPVNKHYTVSIGTYRIAVAPELSSCRLKSFKSTRNRSSRHSFRRTSLRLWSKMSVGTRTAESDGRLRDRRQERGCCAPNVTKESTCGRAPDGLPPHVGDGMEGHCRSGSLIYLLGRGRGRGRDEP